MWTTSYFTPWTVSELTAVETNSIQLANIVQMCFATYSINRTEKFVLAMANFGAFLLRARIIR